MTTQAIDINAREWGPSFPKENRTTVRVNGAHPITISTGVGDNSVELRFPVGFVSVPSGVLDMLTGGFNSDGTAKGGRAKAYFNTKIQMADGRHLPPIQLANPTNGDPVHIIDQVKGIRTHYRTRDRKEKERRERERDQQIARQAEQIAALQALLLAGGKLSAVPEQVAPTVAPSLPFDPSMLTVQEVSARLSDLTDEQLDMLLIAEVRSKNRRGVIDAIGDEHKLRHDIKAESEPTADAPAQTEIETVTE